MENAEKTQLFIKQVIDNLRYRYCREGQIVKITEELEAVKNLLEMFKIRFGDVLSYLINIEQRCLDIYLPHYTIMAFIDNSIYHTFEEREENFFIQVDVQKKNNYTEISVTDSGAAFNSINCVYCGDSNNEYGSIPSTKRRLINHYGLDNILKNERIENGCTTVRILIPITN